jgi:hypothetical protein
MWFRPLVTPYGLLNNAMSPSGASPVFQGTTRFRRTAAWSGSKLITVGTHGILPHTHGITVGTYGITVGTYGPTPHTHGILVGTHEITPGTHGITPLTHGITSGTHTIPRPTHGLRQPTHDSIEAKRKEIEAIDDGGLPLARAEREKMFGDLPEDKRDDESIIARLQLYSITIQTQFPGQPIGNTVPDIFPGGGGSSPTLPTFRFNWSETAPGELRTWHEVLSLDGATSVFLREGAFEESQPFDPADPDGVQVIDWSGVTIVDELDELEIRDANGISLATGNRDLTFAEPVTV